MTLKCVITVGLGLLAWPAASQAALLLSELLYDASGADAGKVFVELYGSPGMALDGWSLEGVNGADGAVGPTIPLLGQVPADGFFVLAGSSGGISEVPEADQLVDFDLQNGPDSLVLRRPSGAVADALAYGVFAAGDVSAGEGAPAPDPPAGQSLARHFSDVDTDDNASDFGVLAMPTPGVGQVVPEPQVLCLLGCSLCALAGWRRRC